MAEGKYYWLKLDKDFFKRHDIRIIEDMKNGKDYILFYLKLLLESLDHNGALRFSDEIPYSENMLATITNTNPDTVRSAIKVFSELKMMEVMDDGTYYMNQVNKMVGSETEWAKKKRNYRAKSYLVNKSMEDKQHLIEKKKEDNVLEVSGQCPTEIEKEIEKEKDNKYSRADSTTSLDGKAFMEIIDYLNEAAGTHYKYGTRKTRDCIKARMNEGFTVDDFKVVIDKKIKGWKGTNMEMYLRPETLFGTKFEGYLNEIETNKVPKWEPKGKRKYDFDALEQEALNQ